MIRNIQFSQCRVHANIGARRLFGRPLRELPCKNALFRSRALFCGGRIPATPGNANCAEVKGGRRRFAKRRTTGPRWNGRDCLNAATVLIAPPGLAMTLAGSNRTLRRMGRAQRNPSLFPAGELMGIATLHPSYKSGTLEERGREPANSDGPVDFVLEAHFRLNADIAPCSFRAPRAERFPPASRMRH